jgi:hypothetical protein
VLFAAAVVLLAVLGALVADVGRIVTARAELQNAVDAAALAGASQLIGFVDSNARDRALKEANALAAANYVAGASLTLASADITFGSYDGETGTFTPESMAAASSAIDSIMVTGRRTKDSPDGPIDLAFASLFGINASVQARWAVATQPRRYVMFVMDRSGSMCYDTVGIDHRYAPNADGTMDKSPTGWYWMPRQIREGGSWKTAWFCAKDDTSGDTVTSFLPAQVRERMLSGTYFRYCSRDEPDIVQSGWLKAPPGVTLHSYYGPSWPDWSASGSAPVSSCDYALAAEPLQPMASSQNAAAAFVDLLNTGRERAGLVTYAWDATLEHQLTDDWEALRESIGGYDPQGATSTPKGMEVAIDEITLSGRADAYGQRIMILLTDGLANTVNGTFYNNPSSKVAVNFLGEQVECYINQTVANAIAQQATRARRNGIRIYTVSFGSGADQDLMPLIARATNGAYYYAPSHASLTDIFRDIFYNLPAVLTG